MKTGVRQCLIQDSKTEKTLACIVILGFGNLGGAGVVATCGKYNPIGLWTSINLHGHNIDFQHCHAQKVQL